MTRSALNMELQWQETASRRQEENSSFWKITNISKITTTEAFPRKRNLQRFTPHLSSFTHQNHSNNFLVIYLFTITSNVENTLWMSAYLRSGLHLTTQRFGCSVEAIKNFLGLIQPEALKAIVWERLSVPRSQLLVIMKGKGKAIFRYFLDLPKHTIWEAQIFKPTTISRHILTQAE